MSLLQTALFAAKKHSWQRRKDSTGAPYIEHPLEVAALIESVGQINDLPILQAALLHDTLEDTDTTYDELVRTFGAEVADIVREVTDDKSLPKDERKRLQIVHAPHKSRAAKTVKLADKLHNLRSLQHDAPKGWSIARIRGYFVWSHAVVQGLRGTNAGLEAALDKVFAGHFETTLGAGAVHSVLPPASEREAALQFYLADMKTTTIS